MPLALSSATSSPEEILLNQSVLSGSDGQGLLASLRKNG